MPAEKQDAPREREKNLIERHDEKSLEKALGKMKTICKVIRNCFSVVTLFSVVFWTVMTLSALGGLFMGGRAEVGSAFYSLVYGLLMTLMLFELSKIFDEVVKESPPFSEKQADRLKAIAIIACSFVLVDLLMSIGFIYEPIPELGFGMVVNDGITEPTLNLNVGMLAFSAIMYSLSAIFRYAALLQQLSDETV